MVRIEVRKLNKMKVMKKVDIPPTSSIEVTKASRARRRQIRKKKISDEKLGTSHANDIEVNRLVSARSKPVTKAQICRLKNRASEQKCRRKKRERSDKLHDERDILAIENQFLRGRLKMVEKSGNMELAEQSRAVLDVVRWIQGLLGAQNPLAFIEMPYEVENEAETENEADEVESSGESRYYSFHK